MLVTHIRAVQKSNIGVGNRPERFCSRPERPSFFMLNCGLYNKYFKKIVSDDRR